MSDRAPGGARERILAAAVGLIAREGLDGVRIARIATEAGVSSALVHYHFADRERLLAEALDYSYRHAADVRLAAPPVAATAAERLAAMVDVCLPAGPALRDDWMLWAELWLRAARAPELRPFAGELYARLHAWFAEAIAEGVRSGELRRCDAGEVADRTVALIDGYGVRALIGDPAMPLDAARAAIMRSLAADVGLEQPLDTTTAARWPRPGVSG